MQGPLGFGFNVAPVARRISPSSPAAPYLDAGGTSVASLGSGEYEITKTSVVAGFNSGAVGTVALTGDFILRFNPQNDLQYMIGVSANSNVNNDYTSIDYALYFDSASTTFYMSGANQSQVALTATGNFFLKRVGTTLTFCYGGTDGVSGVTVVSTRTTSATLYLDSAFNTSGGKVRVNRLS